MAIDTLEDVISAVNDGQISQIDLAKKARISPSAMSMICSGITKSPKHSVALELIKSAKVLVKQNCRPKAAGK